MTRMCREMKQPKELRFARAFSIAGQRSIRQLGSGCTSITSCTVSMVTWMCRSQHNCNLQCRCGNTCISSQVGLVGFRTQLQSMLQSPYCKVPSFSTTCYHPIQTPARTGLLYIQHSSKKTGFIIFPCVWVKCSCRKAAARLMILQDKQG